jgi:hypothetical protein
MFSPQISQPELPRTLSAKFSDNLRVLACRLRY